MFEYCLELILPFKQMITMFKAATNTNSSSRDDINDGCNLQDIYAKDGRFTSADCIFTIRLLIIHKDRFLLYQEILKSLQMYA